MSTKPNLRSSKDVSLDEIAKMATPTSPSDEKKKPSDGVKLKGAGNSRERNVVSMDLVKDGLERKFERNRDGSIVRNDVNAQSIAVSPYIGDAIFWDERSMMAMWCKQPAALELDRLAQVENSLGEFAWPIPFEADDAHVLNGFVSEEFGSSFRRDMFEAAIVFAAKRNRRDPVREYLKTKLPPPPPGPPENWPIWDAAARHFGIGDLPKAKLYNRQLVMQLIAQMGLGTTRGLKVQACLILKGEQGCGKSKAVEAAALKFPNDSGKKVGPLDMYYDDDPVENLTGKDSKSVFVKNLVYQFQELTSIEGASTNRLKALLTTDRFSFRPPYERRVQSYPAGCVFWGTTNDEGFLKDHTGNRRFWVIPIPEGHIIDIDAWRDEMPSLLSQALALFEMGERHYICRERDPELYKMHQEDVEGYVEEVLGMGVLEGILETAARHYLDGDSFTSPDRAKLNFRYMTVDHLYTYVEAIRKNIDADMRLWGRDASMQKGNLGKCMSKLGFKKVQRRNPETGRPGRIFVRKDKEDPLLRWWPGE